MTFHSVCGIKRATVILLPIVRGLDPICQDSVLVFRTDRQLYSKDKLTNWFVFLGVDDPIECPVFQFSDDVFIGYYTRSFGGVL